MRRTSSSTASSSAVGDAGHARIAVGRQHRQRADALGHAPAADHRPRDARDHLEVALRAGRDDVEDLLLGGHAAQRADDAAAQVVARRSRSDPTSGVDSVTPERAAARNDRDLAHRIGAGLEHAEQRVAGFVVRRAASLRLRE